MTVEITSATLKNRIVTIEAIDVSEDNLQRMERFRDDGFEREVTFTFDLTQKIPNTYLYRFLHEQKRVIEQKPRLLIEALAATVGTITNINGRYIDYDRIA